jgi:hypothetical protein
MVKLAVTYGGALLGQKGSFGHVLSSFRDLNLQGVCAATIHVGDMPVRDLYSRSPFRGVHVQIPLSQNRALEPVSAPGPYLALVTTDMRILSHWISNLL